MNKRHRAREKKKAKEKREAEKLKIPSVQAKTTQQVAEERRGEKDNFNTSDRESGWFKKWVSAITFSEVMNSILGLVIAGATIYYALYAARQWSVMRNTLELERPWVAPSGTVIGTLGPTQPASGTPINWNLNRLARIQVRIQNGGRMPATKFRYHMLFKVGEAFNASQETAGSGLPSDEICDKGELGLEYGAGVIMSTPGLNTHLPVYVTPEVVTRFEDILNNKAGLYVVGCLDYSDVTGKPWYRTKIRLVFIPRETDPFSMTLLGNEAW